MGPGGPHAGEGLLRGASTKMPPTLIGIGGTTTHRFIKRRLPAKMPGRSVSLLGPNGSPPTIIMREPFGRGYSSPGRGTTRALSGGDSLEGANGRRYEMLSAAAQLRGVSARPLLSE